MSLRRPSRPWPPPGLSRRAFLASVGAVYALGAAAPRLDAAWLQPGADDLTSLSLIDASARLKAKTVTSVQLTQACLTRIERLQPVLNAFITVTGAQALAEARAADAEIAAGKWRGALHGVPIALKDIVDTTGVRTTGASALFKDRVPAADAEVVTRLKAAGAVMLGKLNLHEFAYGGTSCYTHFGAVHNPWNPDYIAGGSSGGSGAAVAARLCFGALGTDTGGSIRQPSAHCGIVGLKGTYGRVSTRGVLPLSWSLDHVGPMARTVADAAAMLQAIAGYDAHEPTSADQPVPDFMRALAVPTRQLRLGVPRAYAEKLDPDIDAAFMAALGVLATLTASRADVDFAPSADDRTAIRATEAFAYHAAYVAKSPELYTPAVLARIRTGEHISAVAYIEARRRMEQLRRDGHPVFERVDVLVAPTTPVLPIAIKDVTPDDGQQLRNVAPLNLTGFPAVSVPCGFSTSGLPIGLQLIAPAWQEERLIALASAYERATTWHTKRPA